MLNLNTMAGFSSRSVADKRYPLPLESSMQVPMTLSCVRYEDIAGIGVGNPVTSLLAKKEDNSTLLSFTATVGPFTVSSDCNSGYRKSSLPVFNGLSTGYYTASLNLGGNEQMVAMRIWLPSPPAVINLFGNVADTARWYINYTAGGDVQVILSGASGTTTNTFTAGTPIPNGWNTVVMIHKNTGSWMVRWNGVSASVTGTTFTQQVFDNMFRYLVTGSTYGHNASNSGWIQEIIFGSLASSSPYSNLPTAAQAQTDSDLILTYLNSKFNTTPEF